MPPFLIGLKFSIIIRSMKYPNNREEKRLIKLGFQKIAGIDEAGKGALAGPLVAAAVILPIGHQIIGINDSKKLSEKKRDDLFFKIKRKALSWSVHVVENEEIDKNGIIWANRIAIEKCILKLHEKPDYVLIDAIKVKSKIPTKSIINGDRKVISIAAASIIAKVTRDHLMYGYRHQHPEYKFHNHKGYGTLIHQRLIKKHGPSSIHRITFEPIKSLIKKKIRKTKKSKKPRRTLKSKRTRGKKSDR